MDILEEDGWMDERKSISTGTSICIFPVLLLAVPLSPHRTELSDGGGLEAKLP